MKKGELLPRIKRICQCGKEFEVRQKRIEQGRGLYCSQACKYKYRVRPSGLKYVIVKDNPTSFKRGDKPWNIGRTDLPRPVNFKVEGVGYHALHDWVNRHKGKAIICEYCQSQKSVQWANKSHEYKRDLSDWISLCRKCHVKYDRSNNAWGVASKKFNLSKSKKYMKTALVCGAGGFVGSHIVNRLKSEGYWVRGVDLKYPDFSPTQADEFLIYDLRDPNNVEAVLRLDVSHTFSYFKKPFEQIIYFDEVYQLAADMGGAGFVFTGEHDAEIMHNSALINLNVCHYIDKKSKVFYSSSACMYPAYAQDKQNSDALKEEDAYPAAPDSEYGWEKLFSERLFLAYARNWGLDVRIARFHNIYGPEGTYKGGREKAPAAMCRKVIEESLMCGTCGHDPIEVWGTGEQRRSFLYIDDCIDAVRLLMQSDFKEPINIGSEESISINGLAKMAIDISGKDIKIKNVESNAIGVNGRNSDNTLIEKVLNWKPKYTLRQGMEKTFNWIKQQYI